MDSKQIIAAAFAAAVFAPVIAASQTPAPTPTFKAEKCYGIAKASKNDCASTGNNSCGGTSRRDADAAAWVYVPEGLCARITNASLQPKR